MKTYTKEKNRAENQYSSTSSESRKAHQEIEQHIGVKKRKYTRSE
jgi:hypothetical protein